MPNDVESSNDQIERIFSAESIAVVGASRDTKKPGYQVLKNMQLMGYKGRILPVNPRYPEILGMRCFPNLRDIPYPVDLVVFLLPADLVLKTVEEDLLLRRRREGDIGCVIVISGGFRESGSSEGAEREARLKSLLASEGIRLIGPNCQGIVDARSKVNTTFEFTGCRAGGVSIVSQSGALATSFLNWAHSHDLVGLDKCIMLGNMADVDVAEVMSFYADQPTTKVIWAYLEGCADGKRFLDATTRATRLKPVVVLKQGKSSDGAKAVASHTGAAAGDDLIWNGAIRQAGAIRARTVEESYQTARAMEKLPLMRGDRVAVLSVCGGLGIVCVERLLASHELRLARFSDQTVKGLKSSLAPTATVGKLDGYVDMTGSVTERTHFEALSAILEQDGVDGVIFLTTPPNFLPEEGWAREVANAFAQQLSPKPVIVVLGFGDMAPDSRRVLEDSGIPVVDFPDLAVDIMENLAFYSRWRRANESRAKPMTAD